MLADRSRAPAGTRILGLGHYRPANVVTNDDLIARGVDTDDEWITQPGRHRRAALGRPGRDRRRHGRERRRARRWPRAGSRPPTIDLVIVATCTDADAGARPRAPQLAYRLGHRAPGAYDLNSGCSGLRLRPERRVRRGAGRPGPQRAGRRRRAVLRLARHDRPQHLHHPRRRRRRGRGRPVATSRASARSSGAATASSPTRSPSTTTTRLLPPGGPGGLPLGHRHDGADRPRGLPPRPASSPTTSPRSSRTRPTCASSTLIAKQARPARRDRVARDIVTSGNTSAASIPLALSRMVERGEIPSGAPVLLLGFGAGLAYAGQVVLAP